MIGAGNSTEEDKQFLHLHNFTVEWEKKTLKQVSKLGLREN